MGILGESFGVLWGSNVAVAPATATFRKSPWGVLGGSLESLGGSLEILGGSFGVKCWTKVILGLQKAPKIGPKMTPRTTPKITPKIENRSIVNKIALFINSHIFKKRQFSLFPLQPRPLRNTTKMQPFVRFWSVSRGRFGVVFGPLFSIENH